MKHNNFKQRVLTLALAAVFVFGSIAIGVNSYAATATANGTATVIAPMGITKDVDLQFGKFAPGATAGTVVMTAAGVRSQTGGVVLSALNAGAAASFSVTGDTTATYVITLPGSVNISDTATTPNTMALDTFTSTPTTTGTLASGAQTLTVGGTLTVAISQVAGAYTGTFDVTVDYN